MADTKIVANNVSIIGKNIQDKVGSTLVGTRALAKDTTKSAAPTLSVLEQIKTLQERGVTQLTEVWETLKAQLGFEKSEARKLREQGTKGKLAGGIPKGVGKKTIPTKAGAGDLVGMRLLAMLGITGGAATILASIGKVIFGGIGALIAGVVWAIMDGFKGSKMFGGVTGFIGGLLGGIDSGMKGALKGMGKWALIGAGIGSVVPIVGTMIGGLVGALIGGIMGWIGGEKITAFIDKIIAIPVAMFNYLADIFQNIKDWVTEAIQPFVDTISGLAKKIFDPIIRTVKKIINVIKSVLNAVIDSIPDFGFDRIKEMKEKMKFDMDADSEASEYSDKKDKTSSALKKVQAADEGEKDKALSADENKAMIATAKEFLAMNNNDLKTILKDKKSTSDYMGSLNDLMLMAKEEAFGPEESAKILAQILAKQNEIKSTAGLAAAELEADGQEVPAHMIAVISGKDSVVSDEKPVKSDKLTSLQQKQDDLIASGAGKDELMEVQSDIDKEKDKLEVKKGGDEDGWWGKALSTILPGGDEGHVEGGLYKNFFKKFTSKKGALVADTKEVAPSVVAPNFITNNSATSKKSIGMTSNSMHLSIRNNDFLYQDV